MDTKTSVKRLSYPDFLRRFDWKIGEHVACIAPTTSGKTTLILEIIKRRQYVALLLTKPRDELLTKYLAQQHITRIKEWPGDPFEERLAIWPPFTGSDSYANQHRVFKRAIDGYKKEPGIFQQGNWTVVLDEVHYLTQRLKLEKEIEMLWTQGRSNGITVVAGTQRPRDVPQEMLNQSTHYFYWQVTDRYELQRMSDITGNVADIVKSVVPNLAPFEFLYINRRKREVYISKVERKV